MQDCRNRKRHYEHGNEPDTLEHGTIIATGQADELWNPHRPRIGGDIFVQFIGQGRRRVLGIEIQNDLTVSPRGDNGDAHLGSRM